jgi:regulator of protease activity HflC (stomatin/prohibitin superfamily)
MIEAKRGKNVAILAALAQTVFAVVMLVLAMLTQSRSAMMACAMLASGVPAWLMVALLFYARQRARQEEVELEQLGQAGAESTTIFDGDQGELRPAAARVAWLDKWIVPAFTIGWAALQLTLGTLLLQYVLDAGPRQVQHAQVAMAFGLLIGFGGLLLGRYAVGMARLSHWRLLRGPASHLLVGVLVVAAVVLGGLLLASAENMLGDYVVAMIIPVLMLVLGAELAISFITEIYRPRVPGQEARPSFDSRFYNLLAEPDRLGHSIADTLNYQFGFEVSRTWFYQLLSRALVPLLIFAVLVLLALSSLVIVPDGHSTLVLEWGRPDGRGELTSSGGLGGTGLYLKSPWPIGKAVRFPTGQVQEIVLGAAGDEKPRNFAERELNLWTEDHGRRTELNFLIAVPDEFRRDETLTGGRDSSPPVNIIKLVVPVQYTVTDLEAWMFNHGDSRSLLEAMAYREMIEYCARATLDGRQGVDADDDRPEAIMTWGRGEAAKNLKKRIQNRADELDLGVTITYVGFNSAHPPKEAAPAFERVFEAERRIDEKRYQAEAEANEVLGKVAGRSDVALHLAQTVRAMQQIERLQQLRGQPETMKAWLEDAIVSTHREAQSLREEIASEKALSRNRDRIGDLESLLNRQEQHLAQLREIQLQGESFDLDAAITASRQRADRLFAMASGEPVRLIGEATAYRWQREMTERGRYEAMLSERQAYRASPKVYMFDRMMDVWDDVLPNVLKYVVTMDRDKLEVWLNLEENRSAMEDIRFEGPQR